MASETPRGDKPPILRRRRLVIGANVFVQIVALLAVVVMVNWLAARHYVRFDWTKKGYYQLAGKTKQVLASLKDPVDIVVFLPPEDRQRDYVTKILDDVHNLLKEFQFYGKEKLHIEYVDPHRDPVRAEQLVKEYSLDPRAPDVIIFASRGHHKYVRLDEMVDLDTQSQEMGESRVKAFKGEGLFLSAIQTVTEEESPKIYFLTGHGERDPEDFDQREGYSELSRYIKRDNILVQKWNLLESQALPTDAGAIVIAGPHKAFAPSELNALEQYLTGGLDRAGVHRQCASLLR